MPTTATLVHRTGCPERRIETYPATGRLGGRFITTRCIDCGAHDVRPAS
jgi:hypothetical protein